MPMEYSGFPRQESQRVLIITRVLAAPRTLVWKAWTDPAQVKCWMGPRGYTATHLQGEWRPRGAWRACLRRDDNGEELWQGGVNLEIVAPERLVYSFAWEGANGRRGHETRVTLNFSEHRGKTRMDFRQEVFDSAEECDGHRAGWNSTFDRLAEHLGQR